MTKENEHVQLILFLLKGVGGGGGLVDFSLILWSGGPYSSPSRRALG